MVKSAELTSFWGQQKAFNSRDLFVLLLGVNLDESAQKLGCGGGGDCRLELGRPPDMDVAE